jgi:hypothetical protein
MPEPTITPQERSAASIEPVGSCAARTPVWVHVGRSWHLGEVLATMTGSAMVRYRVPGSGNTGIETVTASCLLRRPDARPLADENHP